MVIKIGDQAKDKISGFEGVITGKAEYLYANPKFLIEAESLNSGKLQGGEWFDTKRVKLVKKSKTGFKGGSNED